MNIDNTILIFLAYSYSVTILTFVILILNNDKQ